MKIGLMVLAALCAAACFAKDEFGDLASAKAQHPEFFKPGSVLETSLNDAPWYVYCGDAERCFKDETEEELYQEAEVQAKTLFWEYFAKKDKSTKVSVSGSRRMYQVADGAMRYVVMGVPKSGVKVTKGAAFAPVVPAPAKPVATPVPVKSVVAPAPARSVENVPVVAPAPASAKPVERKPVERKCAASEEASATLDDDGKLAILRARLEKKPLDFRCRIRMARIFNAQGNERRALRNYVDAARLIVLDEYTANEDKVDDLLEVAQYAEALGAGGLALKYYRVLQRMRVPSHAAIATSKISRLLLRFE